MATTEERLPAVGAHPDPLTHRGAWLVVKRTLGKAWQDRVLGMAAEVGFWALVSLPPLLLAMLGTLGYIVNRFDPHTVHTIENHILSSARHVIAPSAVDDTVQPLVHAVLKGGRADVASIGFVLSLWAGSTAMAAYVNTITIAYDLRDVRSAVRSRIVAFLLYLGAVLVGIVVLPLLVIGPQIAAFLAPKGTADIAVDVAKAAYWPFTVGVVITLLATLYTLAIPVRTRWRRALPGAIVAMVLWIVGSFGLRYYFTFVVTRTTAYTAVAAPMAILLWFYITALAVLLGAELNAQIDKLWPVAATARERDQRPAPHLVEDIAPGR